MKHKCYKVLSLILILVSFSALVYAEESKNVSIKEGVHYEKLDTSESNRPEAGLSVLKIFQYGCRACYDFEKVYLPWTEKQSGIKFIAIPATFSGSAGFQAKLYYVQSALDENKNFHSKIFNEIHVNKNSLDNYESMKNFFTRQNIPEQRVKDVFLSNELNLKIKNSESILRQFKVTKLPTIIVNGKYKVALNANVNDENKLLEIVDYLVKLK